MLLDYIIYHSNEGLVQDEIYPEVYHITLDDLAEREYCDACGGMLSPRDSNEKQKLKVIRDYDTRSKCVIIMEIKRKNYRCTKCRKSFTASPELNNLKHTAEFERYAALEVIRCSERGLICQNKKDGTKRYQWSNEVFAKRYGYHRDVISTIAKKHAPAFTPLLLPGYHYRFFHLYSFNYQVMIRYYLVASDKDRTSMLLAVFGYQDPVEELLIYLKFHKKLLGLDEKTIIAVDYDFELINRLKKEFYNIQVTIRPDAIKNEIERYKNSLFGNESVEIANSGSTQLNLLYTAITNQTETDSYLEEWWNGLKYKDELIDDNNRRRKRKKILQTKIKDLWDFINEHRDIFDLVYKGTDDKFPDLNRKRTEINKQIINFSQNGPDFSILAARTMLYGEEYFAEQMGIPFAYTSAILTDENVRADYLKKMSEPDYAAEYHLFIDLLDENFNQEDIKDLLLYNLWKHYDRLSSTENEKETDKIAESEDEDDDEDITDEEYKAIEPDYGKLRRITKKELKNIDPDNLDYFEWGEIWEE